MSLLDPSMEDLPVHIMFDILSRLPVKMIIHCKCVCKKWLNIVLDSYFADLQLSRSPAGFINYKRPGILKWVEMEDELNYHKLHHDPVMSLDPNLAPIMQDSQIIPAGSVNGLICLWQVSPTTDNTYICNPITREYMILPRQKYYREGYANIVYCFGVGVLTREYKVIRIFQKDMISEAEVYTLGTGQWRSLGHVPYSFDGCYEPFLNGHAHWIIRDQEILAFDFDKETFELFPSPPFEDIEASQVYFRRLEVLKGCLCRCDTSDSELTIWMMKEYGIKKSWRKELVIRKGIRPNMDVLALEPTHPIWGFKDGTILTTASRHNLLVYCPWRQTVVDRGIFDGYFNGFAYRPSFYRLSNFENERVNVF